MLHYLDFLSQSYFGEFLIIPEKSTQNNERVTKRIQRLNAPRLKFGIEQKRIQSGVRVLNTKRVY